MKVLIFLILFSFIFISCTKDTGIGVNARVSECGGFNNVKTIINYDYLEDRVCNDVLNWNYNRETKIISFENDNVALNCCGEHSIRVDKLDKKYVITEIDNKDNGARCKCTCRFSYAVDIPDIEGNTIDIILKRDVEENNLETILEKTIDLEQNNGSILIKEQSGHACYQ